MKSWGASSGGDPGSRNGSGKSAGGENYWGPHLIQEDKKNLLSPVLDAALRLLNADEACLVSSQPGGVHVEIARSADGRDFDPSTSKVDWKSVASQLPVGNVAVFSFPPARGKRSQSSLRDSFLAYPLSTAGKSPFLLLLFRRKPKDPPFHEKDGKTLDAVRNIILAGISFTESEQEALTDEARATLRILEKALTGQPDLERFGDVATSIAAGVIGAARAYFFLYETGGSMSVKSSFSAESDDKWGFNVSNEILSEVARSRDVVLDNRVQTFAAGQPPRVHAVLCGPFISDGQELLGQIYLEKEAGKGTGYNVADRNFLEKYCSCVSRPLQRQLAPKTETVRSKLVVQSPRFKYSYDNIIGISPLMQNLYELLDRIVETDHPVIIQGESGTGKELIANAIHFNGPRKNKPFIAENCAALSDSLLEAELFGYVKGAFTGADRDRKGFFEIANGGALFLDEIGEMNMKMQKDLLRVLQEGEVRPVGGKKMIPVDVRIICASNKDLRQLVAESKFREDLYYRLNVMTIRAPSLRERKEDIPLLVEHFLDLIAKETNTARKKVGPGLLEALEQYDWPGNIRELKNELKRMVAICRGDTIQVTDFQYYDKLPILMKRRPDEEEPIFSLETMEKRHIEKVLELVHGNKARAAEILGINRATIFRKIKKYGITA